jgi:CO/xanthine dehydrogenase Mo-binding subunit
VFVVSLPARVNHFGRKEDEVLLQGRGRFVADYKAPQMLEAAFVRSPYAHAKIHHIDAKKALGSPGVVRVVTAADLPSCAVQLPNAGRQSAVHSVTDFTLANLETRYVGEPVAVVLAENRYLAEDAAELVEVDYEPLPVCVSLEGALLASAPLVHPHFLSNSAGEKSWEVGDVEGAFACADLLLHENFEVHRGTSSPMEPRGLIAFPKEHGSGKYTLEIIASTQSPYRIRDSLAEMLAVSSSEIWVRSGFVGGGFGPKSGFYPEDFVVAWLALTTGKPVRWLEDRREHLLCARQERDQLHNVRVAFSRDGKITALHDEFLYDVGAYSTTVVIPWTTAYTLPGPYKIPNVRIRMQLAFTHKVPTMTVRGAGRPEAVFVMERIVDRVAEKLSKDPLDVRRINAVTVDDLPWDTGLTSRDGEKVVYDNVNCLEALDKVAERLQYRELREKFTEENRGSYKKRGIGIAHYVVTTGRGPYELARARVDADGQIVVYTGACPQGQGHHTSLAQVCARELGISSDRVTIVSGDTAFIQEGFGTFASRSAVTAGNAVAAAAREILKKVKEKIATVVQCAPNDLSFAGGCFVYTDRKIQFTEALGLLARHAQATGDFGLLPIEASARFETKGHTFTSGAHGAIVEVDCEAGTIRVLKCVAAHDVGAIINRIIIEGQLHGGVAHGIGNSLLERIAYDENGQVLSSTFKDYLLPLSMDVGTIDVLLLETPAHGNPLGIKGVGEAGTVGVPPAIACAVEHALAEWSVKINSFPINPEEISRWNKEVT